MAVWKALSDRFQRKTWANKLELKRKLFSMKLSEGGSVQEHMKSMTERCEELSTIDEPVSEEDRLSPSQPPRKLRQRPSHCSRKQC